MNETYFVHICRKPAELDFEGYQEPADKAPHFVFHLRDRFIQEGVGFKLLASIEGKPTPTVTHLECSRLRVSFTSVKLTWDAARNALSLVEYDQVSYGPPIVDYRDALLGYLLAG